MDRPAIVSLTEYEIRVLRDYNGEDGLGLQWGGALSAAYSRLCNSGYIRKTVPGFGILTEKGRAALKKAAASDGKRTTTLPNSLQANKAREPARAVVTAGETAPFTIQEKFDI